MSFHKYYCYSHTYVPTYVQTYLPMVPMYKRTYLCTNVPTYVQTYLPMYKCTYLWYPSTNVPTYVQMYLPLYNRTHLCTSVPTHVQTYLPFTDKSIQGPIRLQFQQSFRLGLSWSILVGCVQSRDKCEPIWLVQLNLKVVAIRWFLSQFMTLNLRNRY